MPSDWAMRAGRRAWNSVIAICLSGTSDDEAVSLLASIVDAEHERGCPYHPDPAHDVKQDGVVKSEGTHCPT